MTIDMNWVAGVGAVLGLLVALKTLGFVSPFAAARRSDVEKMRSDFDDVSQEVRTWSGRMDKIEDKLDKLMDATTEIKIHCAAHGCKKDE